MRSYRPQLAALAAVIILSAYLGLLRLSHPASQDELCEYVAASSIFSAERRDSFSGVGSALDLQPHLYQFLQAAAFGQLGEKETSARAVGVLAMAGSSVAVFFSVLMFGAGGRPSNGRAALTAGALFSFLPSSVQGGLNLHPDGSLLVLLTLSLAYCFVQFYREGTSHRGALFAAALAAALWCRLATPLFSVGVFFLFIFYAKGRDAARKLALWAAAGVLLFVATWYAYCVSYGFQFSAPFNYLISAFTGKAPATLTALARQAATALTYVFLWTGAAGGLMFLTHGIKVIRERAGSRVSPGPDLVYLVLGASLVLGYSFIGGDAFGFPKYQAPGLALLCVFSGLQLARAGLFPDRKHALLLIIYGAVLAGLVWGDPIYVMRYRLRELMAAGSPVLPEAGILAVRTLLFCGALYWIACKFAKIYQRAVYSVLPGLSIGTALGLSVLQSFAGYQTNYSYGAEEAAPAADSVKNNIPHGARVLATSDIQRLLGYTPESYVNDRVWNEGNLLLETVKSSDTAAVVYGVATNTVRQVRAFEADGKIKAELERNFEKSRIGTSTVWIRIKREK